MAEQEINFTKEDGEFIGMQIEAIKLHLLVLEPAKLRFVARSTRQQVKMQNTLAVIHPEYPHKKNELYMKQAQALDKLAEFIDLLKECDKLNLEVKQEQNGRDNLKKLFLP